MYNKKLFDSQRESFGNTGGAHSMKYGHFSNNGTELTIPHSHNPQPRNYLTIKNHLKFQFFNGIIVSKKSLVLFTLSTLLLLPLFSACSKKDKEDSKKIIVWHWMSDRQVAFDELAKRYETATGIKVVFELYAPSEVFAQKVRAAAQSNTLPEVYGILAESRDFASFIKSGHVENLTPAMEADNSKWKNFFYPKALATNTFMTDNAYQVPPGIYGVPIDVTTIQMVYNKTLLKKAGWTSDEPPQTWDQFSALAKKLNALNIPPFVSGWGELWLIDCLASQYAIHIMGEEKYFDTLRGKVPYTDPDWVKVFNLFDQIGKEKILIEGGVTMVNKTAEQNFANERAAFAMNGSWCVNVYSGMNPTLDYGVMRPPKLNSKNPMRVWGGAGSSFVVNARSSKKEQTLQFLKWFTDQDQQVYLAETTKNLPSNKNASAAISPLLSKFADSMSDATHPSQWPLQEKPLVSEAFTKGIQSILIGEKTPAKLAEEIQKIKVKEMSAASAN